MPAKNRFYIGTQAMLLIGFLWLTATLAEVTIPTLDRRVTDLTNTLSTQQQADLESRLAAFEQEKGSQIAVLIVPTTQPETIEQYSIRVVDQWRLGRKGVNDGALILLAKNDRTTRIEVGYGLEGAIPDALAKRIIDDIMIPHFRQGDFAGGINAGVDSLIGLIQGEPLPEPVRKSVDASLEKLFIPITILAFLTSFIFQAVFGRLLGSLVNASLISMTVWLVGGGLIATLIMGLIAFFIARLAADLNSTSGRRFNSGGFSGSDSFSSSGGGGGGGFSGGGGGFGGGGASGSW